MDDQKRLFFGFELKAPWPKNFPRGKTLQKNQYHMTIAFLGNTFHEKISDLTDQIPKPLFKIGTTGTFEDCLFLPEKHANVVAWKGVALGEDRLTPYADQLCDFLRKKGYPIRKRPFLNHVTIAGKPFENKEWKKAFHPLPYITHHLHLYESLGSRHYKSIWRHELIMPFEEFEHVADIAFRIHGEDMNQLYFNAQAVLAFECPDLIKYLDRKGKVESLEEIIIKLNEIITLGDREIGVPFKAISFHGDVLKKENIFTWEMIIDV